MMLYLLKEERDEYVARQEVLPEDPLQ